MHLYVSTYGDTHLQTYTCGYLSLSDGYLFPFHSCPGLPLAPLSEGGAPCGSPGQDPGGRGGYHGSPLESLAGSQTLRAVPGCSTQALPGKPFPRKITSEV